MFNKWIKLTLLLYQNEAKLCDFQLPFDALGLN